jgi:hypothetical protein
MHTAVGNNHDAHAASALVNSGIAIRHDSSGIDARLWAHSDKQILSSSPRDRKSACRPPPRHQPAPHQIESAIASRPVVFADGLPHAERNGGNGVPRIDGVTVLRCHFATVQATAAAAG